MQAIGYYKGCAGEVSALFDLVQSEPGAQGSSNGMHHDNKDARASLSPSLRPTDKTLAVFRLFQFSGDMNG